MIGYNTRSPLYVVPERGRKMLLLSNKKDFDSLQITVFSIWTESSVNYFKMNLAKWHHLDIEQVFDEWLRLNHSKMFPPNFDPFCVLIPGFFFPFQVLIFSSVKFCDASVHREIYFPPKTLPKQKFEFNSCMRLTS